MWTFLSFVFIVNLVQSLSSPETTELNNETIKHLNNLQKEIFKVLSIAPDAVWIHKFANLGSTERKYDRQIPSLDDLTLNITADNISEIINNKKNVTEIVSSKVNSKGNKCNRDLIYMAFNFYKMWVIQMLDSAGKFSPGLLQGNRYWVGDFTECRNVSVPLQVINNIHFGDFKGKYCSLNWDIDIKQFHVPLFLGICVPDSCNEEILLDDSRNLAMILKYVPVVKKIENYANLTQITCQNSETKWKSSHIAYMCILSIFITLIVAGTVCDIVKTCNKKRMDKQQNERSKPINDNDVIINSEVLPETETFQKESSESAFVQFLICFSLYTNGAKIFNTENNSSQLQCLHGIRFLSMCWIILGHSFLSAISFTENMIDFLNYIKTFPAQLIIQATFSVDTFFLLSGLLLSYLFLKNYQGNNENVNWVYYYLHRIWRLSPALMMVLGFYTTLWLRLGSGPMWPKETENGHCDKYWWWNLLYIQNFKDISEMCMGWTWYLANDMQFYIISPLFLILLRKFPKVGFIVLYITMGISIIITGVLGTNNNIDALYDLANSKDIDMAHIQTDSQNFFNQLYDKPYCRIGPYLIGIFTGYAILKMEVYKKYFTKKILFFCWILAIGLSSSVLFGTYHVHLGKIGIPVYNAFSRTTWSITVAWMIFACLAGLGGKINTILSWKVWVPLSRLTYSAYLIHPVIIGGFFSSLNMPYYFQLNSIIIIFFGLLSSSYLAAFVVSVAFESSMMALEKFILTKMSKKRNT